MAKKWWVFLGVLTLLVTACGEQEKTEDKGKKKGEQIAKELTRLNARLETKYIYVMGDAPAPEVSVSLSDSALREAAADLESYIILGQDLLAMEKKGEVRFQRPEVRQRFASCLEQAAKYRTSAQKILAQRFTWGTEVPRDEFADILAAAEQMDAKLLDVVRAHGRKINGRWDLNFAAISTTLGSKSLVELEAMQRDFMRYRAAREEYFEQMTAEKKAALAEASEAGDRRLYFLAQIERAYESVQEKEQMDMDVEKMIWKVARLESERKGLSPSPSAPVDRLAKP